MWTEYGNGTSCEEKHSGAVARTKVNIHSPHTFSGGDIMGYLYINKNPYS